jgi:acyl dehydratase
VVKYDFCKATTYEQAKDHLTVSQTLITNATSYWFFELSYDADPLMIDKEVIQYVEKLYERRNGTIC